MKQGAPTGVKYDKQAAKYKSESDQIQAAARNYERESERSGKKAYRFHLGEIFLEAAIVFSSLAILSKARVLFLAGIALAGTGLIISAVAWLT